MSDLNRCPFCGGEAKAYVKDYGDTHYWRVSYSSDRCGVNPVTNVYHTEAEAIAAWNSRAERTCNLIEDRGLLHCSNCGGVAEKQSWAYWTYCPNCGAKVVSA
jgi:DNA-directed RNA polymerase subunit RPC12/RpoP